MTRTDKALLYTVIAAAAPVVVGMLLIVSPRSLARRNQTKIIKLLAQAHAVSPQASGEVTGPVALGDGTRLQPERSQIVAGYVLKLHLQSTSFSIDARPVKAGVTGLLSYFRDATGVIRFDTSGKGANAESRPVAQPVP
jgi:hypothetical protein